MWHRYLASMAAFSTTPLGVFPMEAVRIEIDTKAMRKLDDNEVIAGVFEFGTESGSRGAETLLNLAMITSLEGEIVFYDLVLNLIRFKPAR